MTFSALFSHRLGDIHEKASSRFCFCRAFHQRSFCGTLNSNNAFVGQLGFFNAGVVEQGGFHSTNNALIGQVGAGNNSGIQQGGAFNHNNAATIQFGVGNGAIITQN